MAIEAKGVRHEYASGREVIKSIDISVRKGEIVGLIGPNGAGKTTLCQIIAHQVRRKQGMVAVLGEKIEVHGR
jgi:ABC-type multidrug transport system ATPase subunit